MMMIIGCVTSAVGTIVALVAPVTVIVFIVLPIFPSSAQLVESYACDPGGVIKIEEWSEYDHEDNVNESGTDFLCVYEDGAWTESSTEIMFAMIGFGLLIPGALAALFGLYTGFLGGISPNERKKKKKKKKKKQVNQTKRAGPDDQDVGPLQEEAPSNDEPPEET